MTSATLVYGETVQRVNPTVDFSRARSNYTFEAMADAGVIICGDPEVWIEKLTALEALGIDEVINFAGVEHEAVNRAMRLLGKHVFPRFRRAGSGVVASSRISTG